MQIRGGQIINIEPRTPDYPYTSYKPNFTHITESLLFGMVQLSVALSEDGKYYLIYITSKHDRCYCSYM